MQVSMQHLINGCHLISESNVVTSVCLMARDGRIMASASSAVAVVESQRWVTTATVGRGLSM